MRTTANIALLLGGIVMLGACSADPGDSGNSDDTAASSDEEALSGQNIAFDFFHTKKGLTKAQAAGIIGNLMQESHLRPDQPQLGGGPGRGIAQWSIGGRWDELKHDNAKWYAGALHKNVLSLELQLEFIWYELTHFEAYGLRYLKSTRTVDDAVIAFQSHYEGCGACEIGNRIDYARQVLAAH